MDVVYLVRSSPINEELRYSLRSLVNLPHDRVWIFGGWPGWVRNVNLVETKKAGSQYAHTLHSLLTAAGHPDVSEGFYLFNDDFFVVHPVTTNGTVFHRGEIAETKPQPSNYYSRARFAVGEWLREQGRPAFDYDVHVPMVMAKGAVLAALSQDIPDPAGLVFKRTIYGNLLRCEGTLIRDPKVRGNRDDWDRNAPFVSTADHTFRKGRIGNYLRETFSEPCEYEEA
jgi:hypothetical protein